MHAGEPLIRVDKDQILAEIDRAIPQVYGYLHHRCGSRALAEDLTSETILAIVDQIRSGRLDSIDVGYLIGIARHKLVDHWRKAAREQRHLDLHVGGDSPASDAVFEPGRATAVLAQLNPMQRAALTLRYVDGMSVPEVAQLLDRSVHATETLLVRAKRAFRSRYSPSEDR